MSSQGMGGTESEQAGQRSCSPEYCLNAVARAAEYSHGFSSLGPLKYAADFEHFDYVNPTAPKAGTIRVPGYDTYDSFNHVIDKGIAPAGLGAVGVSSLLYDRLLEPAIGEPASGYGRLADGVWVSNDFKLVAFRLRGTAYWHDGMPLTADDVVFTFETIDFGRKVTYVRVDDYWGKDIAVNKGRYNFDRVKYDYFRDEYVMLEALKGDVIDLREETLAKNWSIGYDFPAVRAGYFKKELIDLAGPRRPYYPLMWNLDKEKFRDIRVREALSLLYGYKWVNRVIHFDFYEYSNSFFYNSLMAQRGLPSSAELKLLEPWRGQIPDRVFTHEWPARESKDYGYDRDALKRALELFDAAGWVLRDGAMVNVETGDPFTIDFVHASPASKRSEGTFIEILNRIGIRTSMSVPEISNWYYRIRTGKFDATNLDFAPGNRPRQLLKMRFGSASADEPWGLNWGNVRDAAVDAMIEHVIDARNPEDFYAATRALDRILLWNFYCVPALAAPGFRLVYWDRFGIPEDVPRLQSVAWRDTWWWDSEKAASVDAGMAALTGKRR